MACFIQKCFFVVILQMLKKMDSLILGAFAGPFILTTAVVVFVLLTNMIANHLNDLLGKGLSWFVFAKLMVFFAMNLLPLALPLAILLASLITFGNLGEHNELTAMKSTGVSLLRVLRPIFLFSIFLAVFSFWFSDKVVPWANLKVYSLLWDIKQKTPTFNLKEGVFYNGLPNYSIRVTKKIGEDGNRLKGVMIYNHSTNQGNSDLILADSGKMYTIKNDKYLVLELFNGKSYHDQAAGNVMAGNTGSNERFVTNKYAKTQIVFDLGSFDMKKTDESLFSGHRFMHGVQQLWKDIDSLKKVTQTYTNNGLLAMQSGYHYHLRIKPDSLLKQETTKKNNLPVFSVVQPSQQQIATRALQQARNIENMLKSRKEQQLHQLRSLREYYMEFHKKFTFAFACITLFLIGAPLGAIIKKGGLGLPVLIAIIFFVCWHVMTISGDKWAKEGVLPVEVGMWFPNVVLMLCGFYFLRQAKNDSRILEGDFYYIWRDKLTEWRKRFSKK